MDPSVTERTPAPEENRSDTLSQPHQINLGGPKVLWKEREQRLRTGYPADVQKQTASEYDKNGLIIDGKTVGSLSSLVASQGIREWLCKQIEAQFGKQLNILSIAAGTGHLEFDLKKRGHTVVAVDICPDFVQVMKQRGLKHVLEGDVRLIEDINLPFNKFDITIISNAIGSIGFDCLTKLKPLLIKDGGILIIDAKYSDELQEQLFAANIPHLAVSAEEIFDGFSKAGFVAPQQSSSPQFVQDAILKRMGWQQSDIDGLDPNDDPEMLICFTSLEVFCAYSRDN